MTDPRAQNIIGFFLENQPMNCSICNATVAFQSRKTGDVLGVGFSGCRCLARVVSEVLSPPDLGKEAATPNKEGEDHVDRGKGKGDFGTERKQQHLEESIKERKLREEEKLNSANEQEAVKKETEEEALMKRREQEEALEKQREEEEARRKQEIEEEAFAVRKLEEQEARKKFKEEEARNREEFRQKLVAEKEEAESRRKAMAKMDFPRKTWTGMKYSPNLKSGAIVHILFSWNPIDFHVVCDEDNDTLALMQDDLLGRVTAGKLRTVNDKLQRDDVVIAEYDGAFYRARVAGASSTQCQLTFIDFGDKTIKKYDEVYEIPEDLFKEPIYGLRVRLDGLDPADLSVEALTSDTVDASVYETAYSLELAKLLDVKDMHTFGILRDSSTGNTLNDVVEKTLQKF